MTIFLLDITIFEGQTQRKEKSHESTKHVFTECLSPKYVFFPHHVRLMYNSWAERRNIAF